MQVSSPQERKGWFFYDAANSVYSALTLSLFAPVFIIAIIQYQVFADLSLDPCSAYETNGSAVRRVREDIFCYKLSAFIVRSNALMVSATPTSRAPLVYQGKEANSGMVFFKHLQMFLPAMLTLLG
jgi:hypothetical protein